MRLCKEDSIIKVNCMLLQPAIHVSSFAAAQHDTLLNTRHDDGSQKGLRAGHKGATVKEEAHIIKFEDIRFALQLRRVVDTHAILLEEGIATGIFWRRCIDRYIIERAASAAHRHECDGEDATADFLQVGM